MKLVDRIKFSLILILCTTLAACDKDDPVVCQTIAIQAGDEQIGLQGQALQDPLQVRVSDAAGKPVANAQVTWEVLSGGGALAAQTSTTNLEGMASANLTFGQEGGRVKASINNPESCTSNAVEFTVNGIQVNLQATATKVEPLTVRSTGCLEFNYTLGYTSNVDISPYFVYVIGEFKYGSEPASTEYYKTGHLTSPAGGIQFLDCYTFADEAYIEDWFTVQLYRQEDVQSGRVRKGALPMATSNKIGPIRTNKPAGAPRLGSDNPSLDIAKRGK